MKWNEEKTLKRTDEKKQAFSGIRAELLVSLFLVLSTVAVFGQVVHYDFVNFDDPLYIEENRFVRMGVSWESILWAFDEGVRTTGYWAPLTLLTFLVDYQLYGMNPGGYHVTNLLLHIVNTLLLFLFFRRATGAIWPSALVAMLFAIHPLHVESVAWVTERKDVLSTLFWILTMLAYARYAKHPGLNRYATVIFLFVAGLTAKPMLVTLPFVLLALDYWPLGRFRCEGGARSSRILEILKKRIVEKIPLMIIALSASLVTFWFQKKIGAVASLEAISLGTRIANTLVAYTGYIQDMFWPANLAVIYPHPGVLPLWMPLISCLILTGITLLVLWKSAACPFLLTGWFWYILTLVPVSGLVVIGPHATADRYTYVPLIGLFVMIAWGGAAVMRRGPVLKIGFTSLTIIVLAAFIVVARMQVKTWADSVSLFEHTVNATENNYVAHLNLGSAYDNRGRNAEALLQYKKALKFKPENAKVHNNIGIILLEAGKHLDAIRSFKIVLEIDPTMSRTHNNLGNAYLQQKETRQAVIHYREALQLNPYDKRTHNGLGVALLLRGRDAEAKLHFEAALKIDPGYISARRNLAKLLGKKGQLVSPPGKGG